MKRLREQFDLGSFVIVIITLALFIVALFEKGFSHDLLLEAGVFLVSVKLIMMAYKNGVTDKAIQEKLDQIQKSLAQSTKKEGA